MEKSEQKNEQEIQSNEKSTGEEKIVNLFEDTGNFHDEEKLTKSYERVCKE